MKDRFLKLVVFLFSLAIFLELFLFFYPGEVFADIYNCDCGPCPWGTCCVWCEPGPTDCRWGCQDCSSCGGGGACFTADTKIATQGGEIEIQDLKEGDVVKSFSYSPPVSTGASQDKDARTFEIRDASVSAIHKTQAPGYFILKTESGREVKVTGEHPFLAIQEPGTENLELRTEKKSGYQLLEEIWERVKGAVF